MNRRLFFAALVGAPAVPAVTRPLVSATYSVPLGVYRFDTALIPDRAVWDMAFLESRRFQTREIAKVFRVPPRLVIP